MLECRGKLDQYLVTKAMSETIIDLFEVIKINEHDGKWLLRLLGVVEVLRARIQHRKHNSSILSRRYELIRMFEESAYNTSFSKLVIPLQ